MGLLPIAALVALGLMLLAFGLRGRRVGNEPRCGGCGYNLTGLEAAACPECGRSLAEPKAIRRGVRRRPKGFIVVGIALVALPIGPWAPRLYNAVKAINPYRFQPHGWVVAAAQDGAGRALDELIRRVQAGALKGPRAAQLADTALQALADASGASTNPTVARALAATALRLQWTNLLAALELAGQLSDAQRLQFLKQCHALAVRARTPVRPGDLIPVHADLNTRGPTLFTLVSSMTIVDVRLGDQVTPGGSTCTAELGAGGRILCGGSVVVPEDAQGAVKVQPRIEFTIYRDWKGFNSKAEALATWEESPELEVIVLPPDAPDTARPVADEGLRPELESCLQLRDVTVQHTADDDEVSVLVMLDVACPGGLPTDVAFDVYAIASNGAHRLTSYAATTRVSGSRGFQGMAPAFDDPEVRFELRSSADVARGTIDITRYWEGMMTLGPIAVQHIRPASPGGAP